MSNQGGQQPQGPCLGKNSLPAQIRLITSIEDTKFEGVIDRVEDAVARVFATSMKAGTSLSCQIVKLMDHLKTSQVNLAVFGSPCILLREGRSYVCVPELDPVSVSLLNGQLEALMATMDPGKIQKDIIDPNSESASSNLPADFVLYIPGCDHHVRIQISSSKATYKSPCSRFCYSKDSAALWAVYIALSQHTNGVSMWLSSETLLSQFHRMKAGQTHGFTLLIRDFLRNAVSLCQVLSGKRQTSLFFPGIFDLAANVRNHYDQKVARFMSQSESKAGGIRKYNNLLKSVLLSHFVPDRGAAVLDLACGHGQDLNKYRAKKPRLFIGTDISNEALKEARKRYTEGRCPYPAEFIQGNLLLPEIFDEIRRTAQAHGVSGFDVISIQLALHYLVGSIDSTKIFFEQINSLLKPGGRFIATFPCCDRIARRLRSVTPVEESSFTAFAFGNDNYRVTFDASDLLRLIPTLAPAIDSQSEMKFESEIEQLDFDQVSQKAGDTWGVKYKFWLVETIDDQEEFMVPCMSLEEMLGGLSMDVEMGGNFSEVINHYTEKDSPVIKEFKRRNVDTTLTDSEEEVFKFYRALVIKKASDE